MFVCSGIFVIIVNSCGFEMLGDIVYDIGLEFIVGMREEVVVKDIVFVVINWFKLFVVLIGFDLSGCIVVDVNNFIEGLLFKFVELYGCILSEVFVGFVLGV